MAVREGEEQWAMNSESGKGPRFGGGSDLSIVHNCHRNTKSSSRLGNTYQLPAGYTRDTEEAKSLLAGSNPFQCDEYEVFMLQ